MKNKKKVIYFFCIVFMVVSTQNVFAYHYLTHIYDWRGDNIYNVCVNEFSDGSHVASIVDLDRGIQYCIVYTNKSSAMEMYRILCNKNVASLDEIIRMTRWKYWFTQNGCIYYRDNGLLYY
ncbi:MAG: hypothetical protein IKQ43_12030 [Treponema sp.]|nr:hypothetical protein [Treponema sp.]